MTGHAARSTAQGAAQGATRMETQAAAIERRRKAGVVAIKTAQRQLGLDDDTYRDMLASLTRGPACPDGKRSATALTLAEQGTVLDHLRRAGAVNPRQAERDARRPGGLRRPKPAASREAMRRMLDTLLNQLEAVTGEPHSLRYADAICRRNGWGEAVDFVSDANLHALCGAVARTLRHKAANPTPKAAAAAGSATGT